MAHNLNRVSIPRLIIAKDIILNIRQKGTKPLTADNKQKQRPILPVTVPILKKTIKPNNNKRPKHSIISNKDNGIREYQRVKTETTNKI